MQSSIATIKPIQGLDVNLETRFARFNFDAQKTPLQDLTKRVSAASKEFSAKVAFHTMAGTAAMKVAVAAIGKVEGVTSVTGPDKDGLIEIGLDPKKRTMYAAVIKAAKDSGVTLMDVPKPKEHKHEQTTD